MPVKIAHLSDLHFGGEFDPALWLGVENDIKEFSPKIIVVSGDLVDDPRQDHLVNVVAALRNLATAAGAWLYMVPGNHDLFRSGIATVGGRMGWFDHVCLGTTAHPDDPPGPEPAPLDNPRRGHVATFLDRAAAMLGIGKHGPAPLPPEPRIDGTAPSMLREPPGTDLLLALIDSNATDDILGLATGRVSDQDLSALDTQLKQQRGCHLARIAVIHHHVLPIARRGSIESMMVLQNAGDVLDLLARHRFDLVLHGHQHRTQFARIDFDPADAEGYPIAVASAGSAALFDVGNALNEITVSDNGRLLVESLHYRGAGDGPNREGIAGKKARQFHEPLESVKRRAFIRASREHPIAADRRKTTLRVSEDGATTVEQSVLGLRRVRGNTQYLRRPLNIAIPSHGECVQGPELDAESRKHCTLGRTEHGDFVHLGEDLGTRPASYSVHYALANSMNMTLWEAGERAKAKKAHGAPHEPDWDHEFVGLYINYPVEEIEIGLTLPPSMADMQPFVSCKRRRGFPNFGIDEFGNADTPKDAVFDADSELTADAEASLRREGAAPSWTLKLRRPLVGYRYRLMWKLRQAAVDETAEVGSRHARETLLGMAPSADRATKIFSVLAAEYARAAGSGAAGEACTLSLFVYDEGTFKVRPVLWHGPAADTGTWQGLDMKLGEGLAGAAFLQRGTIPWIENSNLSVFLKPKQFDMGAPMRSMLAIPVFHDDTKDLDNPPPWSVIGVATFGTTHLSSRIAGLRHPAAAARHKDLRQLTHIAVHEIITTLRQGGAG